MSNRLWFGCWILLGAVTTACLLSTCGAVGEEWSPIADLPRVAEHCEVYSGDERIVAIFCRPSLDGRYRGALYYVFTKTLEPNNETRFKYDLLLNGLIGLDLGFCEGCPPDGIAKRARAMVAALDPSELERFAEVLYLVRMSPVWADGNRSVVLELLGLSVFEPVGLRLLASHIEDLAREGRLGAIRLTDVAALVMARDTEFDGVYHTILSEASKMEPHTFREFGVQVMAVIGIAVANGQPLDMSVLAQINDRAEQEVLVAVKELVASVKGEHNSAVDDERRFEEMLTRLFELDCEE